MALCIKVVNHLTDHLLTLIAITGSRIHAFQEIFLGQVVLGRKAPWPQRPSGEPPAAS